METINYNLGFTGCLVDFFKNCFSNPLFAGLSEIENFVCKYYGVKRTQNIFYEKMIFLCDSFFDNRTEFENEVKKIKEFIEWQLF